MPAKKTKENFQFEKALEELNSLVEKMEQGDLTLEKSLAHFEKGIGLIRDCQKALNEAEQKVMILTQENNNESLKPYPNDE